MIEICRSYHLDAILIRESPHRVVSARRRRRKNGGRVRATRFLPRRMFFCRPGHRRGKVERRIRTAARNSMEGYEYPIFLSKTSVSYLAAATLGDAFVRCADLCRHSLGRDESENPSLCSREMTYCLPRIWVLHRAWRRGIIRDSSLPSPTSHCTSRLKKLDH